MIRVSNLAKQFGNLSVLRNINIQIATGECIAIIGPSGAGKSMLLRSLALLEKPDCGAIQVNGTDITKKGVNINRIREKMGMVYQGFHLFSHLNVIDNITLAPQWVKKQTKKAAEEKAMELLDMVGLIDKAKSYPHELSGGQRQRIAIARCLAMGPEIIMLDEPTSALDPTMTREVLAIIRKLAKMGLTMLIVTHEMDFAQEVADRVFYMDEGEIYEEGTPDRIFENPQREKTKAFIKRLQTFNFKIKSVGFDMVTMNAQIEVFCQKYSIEAKRVYNIQLLLEELIMEILRRYYQSSQPDVEFTIAYSDVSHEISICLAYRGELFIPFEYTGSDIDNLGMVLVTKFSKGTQHTYEDGLNKVHLILGGM